MNFPPSLLFVAVALLPVLPSLHAQAPGTSATPEPPPDPPYVAPLPKRVAWTLIVDKPANAAPGATPANVAADSNNAGIVRQLDTVKIGDVRRVLVTNIAGGHTDYYHIGNAALLLDRVSKQGMVVTLNPSFPFYEYYSNGFYGMDHVKVKDFQRTIEFKGTRCHFYRGVAKGGGSGPEAGGDATYEAWVDEKSRLPVAYRESGHTLNFVFSNQPEGDIQIPPALDAAWKEFQENARKVQSLMGASRR